MLEQADVDLDVAGLVPDLPRHVQAELPWRVGEVVHRTAGPLHGLQERPAQSLGISPPRVLTWLELGRASGHRAPALKTIAHLPNDARALRMVQRLDACP